jgi:uncharacterized membrane protein YgdD (TMEM256/DUF423 family)
MNILRIAGILGFLGVALGAFGAHALRDRLSPAALQIWNTAVLYHLLHAVALLALGLYGRATGTDLRAPSILFTVGILVFSGSLYALALSGIKPLGAITPIGGVCLLVGWALVAFRNA